MNDNGAPIYAISIQNEPNFTAAYEGCEWTSVEHMNFFLQEGHFTDGIPGYGGGQTIPSVKTVSGESANRPEDVVPDTLNNRESRANLDIVARHYYSYQQNRYALALDDPGYGTDKKEVWQTEHNINSGTAATYPNDSTWNYVWPMMNEVDCSQRLNDESAFVWWYGKRFYSFVGDGQYGTTEHEIMPRGYAMAHYSRFATDTTRVGITTSGISSINNSNFNVDSTVPKATAYESMDGNSLSLIIYTPTTTSGANGVNLGNILINLPWEASGAYALVSDSSKKLAYEMVMLNADKKSAVITVPANTIVSVKFTK
jgi:O-glycosyl hydrolase